MDANAAGATSPAGWEAYAAACSQLESNPRPQVAVQLLAVARSDVARALGTTAPTVTFTSGGTEAAARALYSLLGMPLRASQAATHAASHSASHAADHAASHSANHAAGYAALHSAGLAACHIVISSLEHAAVADTVARWVAHYPQLHCTTVAAGSDGQVDLLACAAAMVPTPALLSVVMASNETGVVQPLGPLRALCRAHGVRLHTDAVQAVGRLPIHFDTWAAEGLSALSFSGHKIGAVGGTGACLLAPRCAAAPFCLPDAGPQQVAGACSLAAALSAVSPTVLQAQHAHLTRLRDGLESMLCASLPNVDSVGHAVPRLPNTSCMRFAGCEADGLLMALDLRGFAVSTGSACSSGSIEASPILLGMGLTAQQAKQTLRFSLPATARAQEVTALGQAVIEVVQRARRLQRAGA
jgi:cysteine desulfurase